LREWKGLKVNVFMPMVSVSGFHQNYQGVLFRDLGAYNLVALPSGRTVIVGLSVLRLNVSAFYGIISDGLQKVLFTICRGIFE
jgi:hypothetical protein